MNYVAENQLLAVTGVPGAFIRVLWAVPGGQEVVTFDASHPRALPQLTSLDDLLGRIEFEELELCSEEPAVTCVMPDSSLTEAAKKIRDRRLEVILPLLSDPARRVLDREHRHALLAERSAQTGVARKDLYAWLRLWWRGGQTPNALVPRFRFRGGRGKPKAAGAAKRSARPTVAGTERPLGLNVTPEMAKRLQHGVGLLKKGKSWSQAYDDTMLLMFSVPVIEDGQPRKKVLPVGERPTFGQFKYWVRKQLRPGDIDRAVVGEVKFARNHEARPGTARDMPTGPGSIFQIDATVANIYLKSRFDPTKLVGRPVLYLVTDQYSRMIVGFTVALAAPSWEIAKLALENTFTDKVESCKAAGVEISEADWPCHHIPRQLTGDRGWDILGKHAGAAGTGLNFTVANLPPYRPDLKGLIESRFEWLDHASIRWAPGATQGRNRGDKDDRPHDLDGFYTLEDFRKFMILAIRRYNRTLSITDPPSSYPFEDAPTPIKLWNWGCRHLGAPQTDDSARIRTGLLHVGEARETDRGLQFGKLCYWPTNPALERAFDRTSRRKWRRITVRHDPRDVNSIVVPQVGGTTEAFSLISGDTKFSGCTLEEVDVFYARRRALTAMDEDDAFDAKSRFNADIDVLNAAVRARSAGAFKPESKIRLTGNKELRDAEVRDQRSRNAWTSSGSIGQEPIAPQPKLMPAEAERTVVAFPLRPNRISLLRQVREGATDVDDEAHDDA
jgi:putative transposase